MKQAPKSKQFTEDKPNYCSDVAVEPVSVIMNNGCGTSHFHERNHYFDWPINRTNANMNDITTLVLSQVKDHSGELFKVVFYFLI